MRQCGLFPFSVIISMLKTFPQSQHRGGHAVPSHKLHGTFGESCVWSSLANESCGLGNSKRHVVESARESLRIILIKVPLRFLTKETITSPSPIESTVIISLVSPFIFKGYIPTLRSGKDRYILRLGRNSDKKRQSL